MYLNKNNIKTHTGKIWTLSSVFSVMKRFRQRQDRLAQRNKRYPTRQSKMAMKFEKG